MIRKSLTGAAVTWMTLAVFACITVNIYFPEAAVKKTAEEIVDEIRGAKDNEAEKKEDRTVLFLLGAVMGVGFLPPSPASIQEETTVSTPGIRALKQSLKDRFPLLVPFFDGGRIGEGIDGFVSIRNESDLPLQQRAELRKLIKDENADRKDLYAAVAEALDIEAGQIPRVQKIFAENWIAKAHSGWWIQTEDGSWIRKGARP